MESNLEDAQTKPTINTILERITDLGANLNSRVDRIQTDVNSLRAEVATLTTNVGALTTYVVALATDVSALTSDVGTINTRLDSLKKEFQLFRGNGNSYPQNRKDDQ